MLIVYDCLCFALAIATQLATYDNVLFYRDMKMMRTLIIIVYIITTFILSSGEIIY